MAKTFKSNSTNYVINGIYFDRAEFTPKQFEIESASKSERAIKSAVAKQFGCKTADIKIENIKAVQSVTTYKVNATLAEIIAACEAAGIVVNVIDPSAADDSEDEAE